MVKKKTKTETAKAEEKRSHNFSLSWRQIGKFEEFFWKLMVLRQVMTVAKRTSKNFVVPWSKTLWFGKPLATWITDFDWEEPVVANSAWHTHRVDAICTLGRSDWERFCLCLVIFYFGSDSWIDALKKTRAEFKDAANTDWDGKNLAWLYEAALRECSGNPWRKRYCPQRIRANEWDRVAASAVTNLLSFDVPWAEFSEDENMDVPDPEPITVQNPQVAKMLVVQRSVQGLPTVGTARQAFQELQVATSEEHKWAILAKLPGLGGTGYAAKNLSLFLRECVKACKDVGSCYSGGGSGPRQAYNLQAGLLRKQPMSAETLQAFLSRDLLAAPHYWNGNFFGKAWAEMNDMERKPPHAVAITSFRCALDKTLWKIYLGIDPPGGFPTWRLQQQAIRNGTLPVQDKEKSSSSRPGKAR